MKKLIILLCLFSFVAQAQDTITIRHQRYTTTFDKTLYYPVLVHWIVTANEICAKHTVNWIDRSNYNYIPDPLLPDYTNLKTDYANAHGTYQAGHNDDAEDNTCAPAIFMQECFYYSNFALQTPHLNMITWKALEKHTQDLAKSQGSVEVWCGSYGSKGKMGRVTIPAFCWKVIRYGTTYESYIFPNTNDVNTVPYTSYMHSISSIKQASGLRLPGLPNL